MWDWTMATPMMIFGFIFMVLISGALIAGAVWLAHTFTQDRQPPRPTALDELDLRYARGDIDRDDYLHRREDLERL